MKYTKLLALLIFLLLLSFLKMPYFYYQILKWVVCIANGYIAWQIAQNEPKNGWLLVFVGIAILFNPIIPFYFGKTVWIIMDMLVILFYAYFIITQKNTSPLYEEIEKEDTGIEKVKEIHNNLIPGRKYGNNPVCRTKQEVQDYFSRNDIAELTMQIGIETFELFVIDRDFIIKEAESSRFNESHIGKYGLLRYYPAFSYGFVLETKERGIEYILNEFDGGKIIGI